MQVDPIALDSFLSVPYVEYKKANQVGAAAAHLLITLATVEKHNTSKHLCFCPVTDDIRNPFGILCVIQVLVVPEPGVGRQIDLLSPVLRFALKSGCEPGLKLLMFMNTIVQAPERSGNIMNCDCNEFKESKFPGNRPRHCVLICLKSLWACQTISIGIRIEVG